MVFAPPLSPDPPDILVPLPPQPTSPSPSILDESAMYFQTVLVLFLASFVAAAPLKVTLRVGGGIITGGSSLGSTMYVVDHQHEMARPQLYGGLDSDSEHASHMLPPAGAQVMLGEKPATESSSSSPSATIGDMLKTWSCNLSG